MRAIAAVGAIPLGLFVVVLAMVSEMAWLGALAFVGLAGLCSALSLGAGVRGEPTDAVGWGAWCAVSAFGFAAFLEHGAWTQGRWWAWPVPLLVVMLSVPVPVLVALWSRCLAKIRARQRVLGVVAKRRALGRVLGDLHHDGS